MIDGLLHRDDKDFVRGALQLLEGAPPELALGRPLFAVHVIEESRRVDPQLGAAAESILVGNTQMGAFNRTPGQPSPKYASLKERSEALRDRFAPGSTGHRLFTRICDGAVAWLDHERLQDEEMNFE